MYQWTTARTKTPGIRLWKLPPLKPIQHHQHHPAPESQNLLFGQLIEELIFNLHIGNQVHLPPGSIFGDVLGRKLVWLNSHHLDIALVHLECGAGDWKLGEFLRPTVNKLLLKATFLFTSFLSILGPPFQD